MSKQLIHNNGTSIIDLRNINGKHFLEDILLHLLKTIM